MGVSTPLAKNSNKYRVSNACFQVTFSEHWPFTLKKHKTPPPVVFKASKFFPKLLKFCGVKFEFWAVLVCKILFVLIFWCWALLKDWFESISLTAHF